MIYLYFFFDINIKYLYQNFSMLIIMPNLAQTNMTKNQKLTKYLLMGLVVFLTTRYIPDNLIQTKEAIMIGATSAITFAILDMVSPSIKVNTSVAPNKPIVEKFI